jgi:hypothetical protein
MESPSDSVNNPILKLSNEHRIIMNYVVRLEKALEEGDYSGLVASWKAVEVDFQREIQAHFSLEERVIFPSALLGLSTAESVVLVLSLQKEHGIVEGLLAEIVTLVDVDGGRTMVLLRDTLTRGPLLVSCLASKSMPAGKSPSCSQRFRVTRNARLLSNS